MGTVGVSIIIVAVVKVGVADAGTNILDQNGSRLGAIACPKFSTRLAVIRRKEDGVADGREIPRRR